LEGIFSYIVDFRLEGRRATRCSAVFLTAKIKKMGTKHTKSQRVIFDYFLTDGEGNEFCLGVTAQVTFGKSDSSYPREMQTGQDEPDEVEAITCAWNDEKGVAGEIVNFFTLPEAMRQAIEQRAIEEACEKTY
jgi:hypothetical protein